MSSVMSVSKPATDPAPSGRDREERPGEVDGGRIMMHGSQQLDAAATLPPKYPSAGSSGESRIDEQLLDDYRHGDNAAFARLVDRYQRELFHFLVRFLGNRSSAEDVF